MVDVWREEMGQWANAVYASGVGITSVIQ